MSKELFSRIITKDKVQKIPEGLVHFYHPPKREILDIPLNMMCIEIEEIRETFGQFSSMEELIQNKRKLSANLNVIIKIVETLELKSFLIEHIDDLDWATNEFIQVVVKDGQIIKGSTLQNTDEEGDLYSTIHLGYDYSDYIYNSYETAIFNYNKRKL